MGSGYFLPVDSVDALPAWLIGLMSKELGRYHGVANDRLLTLLLLLNDFLLDAGPPGARVHAMMVLVIFR